MSTIWSRVREMERKGEITQDMANYLYKGTQNPVVDRRDIDIDNLKLKVNILDKSLSKNEAEIKSVKVRLERVIRGSGRRSCQYYSTCGNGENCAACRGGYKKRGGP